MKRVIATLAMIFFLAAPILQWILIFNLKNHIVTNPQVVLLTVMHFASWLGAALIFSSFPREMRVNQNPEKSFTIVETYGDELIMYSLDEPKKLIDLPRVSSYSNKN